MSYEQSIKKRIKGHINTLPEESGLENRELENIVDECVTVDEPWPIELISAAEFNTNSRKPSNIKVEFDIEASFEILAQGGYLSGDPTGAFAALCSLCALVSRKTKIDLEPETGFVYWVAYDNQQDPWEIREQKLVELASEKSQTTDVHFDLSQDEVKRRIQRLCDIKSFKKEYKHGKKCLVLRERCSSDWLS